MVLAFVVTSYMFFIYMLEKFFATKVYAMQTAERTVLRVTSTAHQAAHQVVESSILRAECDPNLRFLNNPYLAGHEHHEVLRIYGTQVGPVNNHYRSFASAVFESRRNNLSSQHTGIWYE